MITYNVVHCGTTAVMGGGETVVGGFQTFSERYKAATESSEVTALFAKYSSCTAYTSSNVGQLNLQKRSQKHSQNNNNNNNSKYL